MRLFLRRLHLSGFISGQAVTTISTSSILSSKGRVTLSTVSLLISGLRTISANEISFNGARFGATWMLDDANVRGRLSLTEAHFGNNASISTHGLTFRPLALSSSQLVKDPDHAWQSEGFRLFYLQCCSKVKTTRITGQTLGTDARWNARLRRKLPITTS